MRQPREGIVLPADGSEPLMPGTAGGDHTAPAGGAPWGSPWGPDAAGPPPPPAAPGQPWGAAPPAAAPLPPESGALPYEGQPTGYDGQPTGYDGRQAGYDGQQQAGYDGQQAGYADPGAYGGGLPYPQQQPPHIPAPQPPQVPPQVPQPQAPHSQISHPQFPQAPPLPPVAMPGGDVDATQFIPPMSYAPPGEFPAPGAADATQLIPPVAPGALPPETPPDVPADATHYLGRATPAGPVAGHAAPGGDADATQFIAPVPPAPAAAAPVPEPPSNAPYGIRPGAPGDRPPPAEFDSLFRTEPEPEGPAATQQMPRFDPRAHTQAPHGTPPQAPYAASHAGSGGEGGGRAASRRGGGSGRGGRSGSKTPLFAALGVGLVVVGVGVGALLSGGGDDGKTGDDSTPVSATAPTGDGSGKESPAEDPAKQQAVELDKLLADSGGSRATVIKSVADINKCDNLDGAASDLRDAAKQRNDLVTRLGELSVDKLPQYAKLTSALTTAWKASAEADDHYAAWAGEVDSGKGCKKGHARQTGHSASGNRASGEATKAKREASALWNTIAKKFGLTTRQPTQL
ncbi:hypothetical protein ACFVT5_11500 [Streptomyces sp. NPDC058001]|uniref:hypothetical protein n=1 Tax=Streptomyces sp. NPDC058001 TaxID=3346300 RepID=UPI0036EC3ACC